MMVILEVHLLIILLRGTAVVNTQGGVIFNEFNTKNSTEIYIHENDDEGIEISNFLTTVDSVSNPIKGFVRISEKFDTNKFLVFQITDLVHKTANNYWTLTVSNQSGSSLRPFDPSPTDIIINFVTNGNRGPSFWDIQDSKDSRDIQDTQVSKVYRLHRIPRISGYTGYTGFQGFQGYTGYTGFQGSKDTQVTQDSRDFRDTQATQVSRISGIHRYTGFQGFQGYTGYTGFKDSKDIQDTQVSKDSRDLQDSKVSKDTQVSKDSKDIHHLIAQLM